MLNAADFGWGLSYFLAILVVLLVISFMFCVFGKKNRGYWKALCGWTILAVPSMVVFLCVIYPYDRVEYEGDAPRPRFYETQEYKGFAFLLGNELAYSNIAVVDTDGSSVPFTVDNDRIVVNDAKHRNKDIVVTWTAELFGNMKATIRRAENRLVTKSELYKFGGFLLAQFLFLLLIVRFGIADSKKEKNPDGH